MTRRRNRKQKEKDPYALYRGYNFIPNDNIKSDNCPRVFFKVHLFKCPCNDPKYYFWESPLSGAEDGEFCDNIMCRNNPPIKPYQCIIGKTPCQADERSFGAFKCHREDCGRTWNSAHSWSDCAQKCEVCNIKIYPHDQDNLAKPQKNPKKNHQTGKCEKCAMIKGDCSKLRSNGSRRRRTRRRRRSNNKNKGDGQPPNPFNFDALNVILSNIQRNYS